MRLFAILASFVFLAPMAATAAAPNRAIQEDDYRRLISLSSPAISPDGRRAAVVVTRTSWNENKRKPELVLVDLATHASRVLTYDRSGVADPAFSPDGSRLAFIADNGTGEDATSQVFVIRFDGGDARPITSAKAGVDQFAWRPDGAAIAYAARDPKPVRKGADRFRDSFVFTTEPITQREAPRPAHLFVVSADGGAPRQLTFGPESVATGEAASTLSWSPDGRTIAFTLVPSAILNEQSYSHVELVDVASGRLRALTGHAAFEADPRFSPDGKHIAYVWSHGDGQVNQAKLYVTTPQGGEGAAVSAPYDRTVADASWLPDSESVLFTCDRNAAVDVVKASLAGPLQRLEMGDLNIASPLDRSVSRDGSMVFVATTTRKPSELYLRTPLGQITALTDFNAPIAGLSLASSQRITFPTSLGIEADAVLVTPPGYDSHRKYPLVLHIHGGPTSTSVRGFSFLDQLMAARGWLVLAPNYRGSTDLGSAYQRAVLYDPEEGPGKDIMAAIQAVRRLGIVDDGRIAVSGWSYGGIMTAWMISKYHIWKAAVSGASVDDWITDYGIADDSLADVDLFHGSPFVGNNAAEWRQASAINYVRDVTTPVLILGDIGDNRDPFATSSMYWRALRDNHKDATLRAWPVEGHFPADPVRTLDVYHHWIEFIASHFR